MTRKRRNFSAQFKFNVALEAVKLASEHGVHPNQITRWKQQLAKGGAEIFSRNPSHEQEKSQAVETDLFVILRDCFLPGFCRVPGSWTTLPATVPRFPLFAFLLSFHPDLEWRNKTLSAPRSI